MSGERVILLVEDDAGHAQLALRALERSEGLEVIVVESIAEARGTLGRQHVDLVLADLHLPDGSGLDLLDQPVPVVVQTSQGDEARAVTAMKGGALDYCVKSPETFRELPIIIERALNASHHLFERRRAERSLRESDERFRQLATSIPEVFWLFDLGTGAVVYASPAWERIYGAVPRSWEGRLTQVAEEHLAPLRSVAPTDGEVFRVVDGRAERWVEERRFPIVDAQGRLTRLSCLAVDVTKSRELEHSLRHAQKMQAIGQLAGGVAHDFNNMLAAILSAAGELSRSDADPELCELIIQASRRASELTRNLLSYSRKGKVGNASVDVHQVVQEAVALLSRSVDRRVTITTSLEAAQAVVMGDAAQLQSAVLNLGINSRDALPGGGSIHFATRVRELDERAARVPPFELKPGPHLELAVRDTGAGIPPELLPRIFEPFFTSKEPGRGSGLGLAAVYGAVVEHQGAVQVRSTPGEGTEFVLLLPLARTTSRETPVPGPVAPAGRGLVLLVDDEPLVLRSGKRILESLGHEVVTAVDGEAGWREFETHRARLVAVVCDLTMPRLGGRELVLRIRQAAPGFPCLICSGYTRDADGASLPVPVLAKPFARAEFAQLLADVIATGVR
jgi:PAS domain S-box-containing protein